MNVFGRRVVLTAAICGGFVFGLVGNASGSLLPTTLDFGSQEVGTSSAPKTATLDPGETCFSVPFGGEACFPNIISPAIAVTGPFTETSDCGPIISSACTIGVVFKPTSAGPKTGTLTSGSSITTLKGTGLARNNTQSQNSPNGGSGGGGGKKHHKKCKRKHKHKGGHQRVLLRKCHKHHKHHN